MEALLKHQSFFRTELEKKLNSISTQNSGEEELLNAIKYSLISKTAKYIRSFLIIETGKMLQCDELKMKDLLKIAFAIEMIHCYSLIHDDLPSMDNSDFRRGEPSLHKKFHESTALLAGNSLLTLAFKELSQINDAKMIPAEALIQELQGQKVFVLKSGMAKMRKVKTDIRTETEVQIVEGVEIGDTVFTSGILQLREDLPVSVVSYN
jgi:geranylgeranyl pyrophosphate synthase